MTRYRIICPDCAAIVITETRLSALLEYCPKCKRHIWDMYDALLADRYSPESGKVVGLNMAA
jgi:Zn-finger nucleic acid-binding protein